MTTDFSKTAILLFARSSLKELEHKTIPNALPLFDYFNQQTLGKVKKTKLPFFLYSEKNQNGHSFGARFTNAIEDVFAKGFQNVIAIGNDSPNLKTAHILEAVEKLAVSPMIVGPSTDGGIYLLGLRKENFDKNRFLKLPWQTSKLRKSLIQLNELDQEAVCFLKRLSDIDSLKDIKDFFVSKSNLPLQLKQLLLLILKIYKEEITFFKVLIASHTISAPCNKGSPIIV